MDMLKVTENLCFEECNIRFNCRWWVILMLFNSIRKLVKQQKWDHIEWLFHDTSTNDPWPVPLNCLILWSKHTKKDADLHFICSYMGVKTDTHSSLSVKISWMLKKTSWKRRFLSSVQKTQRQSKKIASKQGEGYETVIWKRKCFSQAVWLNLMRLVVISKCTRWQ